MKRGFTLIEMLGILVVLSVMILISLPSIIETNRKSKESEIADAEKTIFMAAEVYLEINDAAESKLEKNKYYYVKMSTLVSEGLLLNSMKNPHPNVNLEKTVLEEDYWVEMRISNGNIIYKIVAENPYEDEMIEGDLVYTLILDEGGVVKDKFKVKDRYVYSGGNQNNYLKFNNETWRIVALEPEGQIKIVKDDYYGSNASFVDSNNETLLDTLNNNYYKEMIPSAKNLIDTAYVFNVGTLDLNNLTIEDEDGETSSTKIGLLNPSDYINASSNAECSVSNTSKCRENNYLSMTERWWLINPEKSGGMLVAKSFSNSIDENYNNDCVTNKGQTLTDFQKSDVPLNSYPAVCVAKVRPAVYLKSKITITSGNGSKTSPYVFSSLE